VLTQQVHDYNPHIEANGLFWTVPVSDSAVKVDFDSARARLRVRGLELFDDHDLANSLTSGLGLPGDLGFPYPQIPGMAAVAATVSFDLEWSGPLASAQVRNAAQGFRGTFFETGCTIKWSARQKGFRFQSEDPDPTRNVIAIIGRERNGVFFS
jgi:hypothetical protein